jgi:hypothetical protein
VPSGSKPRELRSREVLQDVSRGDLQRVRLPIGAQQLHSAHRCNPAQAEPLQQLAPAHDGFAIHSSDVVAAAESPLPCRRIRQHVPNARGCRLALPLDERNSGKEQHCRQEIHPHAGAQNQGFLPGPLGAELPRLRRSRALGGIEVLIHNAGNVHVSSDGQEREAVIRSPAREQLLGQSSKPPPVPAHVAQQARSHPDGEHPHAHPHGTSCPEVPQLVHCHDDAHHQQKVQQLLHGFLTLLQAHHPGLSMPLRRR